jgi:activator of HSP90 ATPase
VSLEENKKIEMKWKFKEWVEFSDCTITFEGTGSTDISVKFRNIPERDKFGNTIQIEGI